MTPHQPDEPSASGGALALYGPYVQRLRVWRSALALLAASRDPEASRRFGVGGLIWRAASTDIGRGHGTPAVRLLHLTPWTPSGDAGESFFLQGYNHHLYLRHQGALPADELHLSVTLVGGRRPRRIALKPLPNARRFALTYLNGGGEDGLLWAAPGLDARQVLGGGAEAVALELRRGAAAARLPALRLEGVGGRAALESADGGPAGARIARLIQAYLSRRRQDFAAALSDLAGPAAPERWRALSRSHALWLSAMVAELSRCGLDTWQSYGCSVLRGHPQLLTDPEVS
jgi:hypothetical protein